MSWEMRDALSDLRDVVSFRFEGGEAGDVVDWEAAAAEFDVPGFPADYREFVGIFGAGSLEDNVFVSIPRLGDQVKPLTICRIRESQLVSGDWDSWQDSWTAPRPDPREMIAWGGTAGADSLFWVAKGDDPDRWPVAVWERHGGGWALYECGMVEFILRVLQADFKRCPFSDISVWGKGGARFLNFRDEDRLWDEGIDPWDEM